MSTKKEVKTQINWKDAFNIPNCICYFRIACVPAFIALMVLAIDNVNYVWWALGTFLIASGSDLVDGKIARKFNMVTGLGKTLDPLADKLMHVSILLCLSFCVWYVHWAFTFLIMLKELLMIIFAAIFLREGMEIKANMLGKVGSALISAGVIVAFFTPLASKQISAPWQYDTNVVFIISSVVLAVATSVTIAAAVNYLYQILTQRKLIAEGKLETADVRNERERLEQEAKRKHITVEELIAEEAKQPLAQEEVSDGDIGDPQ